MGTESTLPWQSFWYNSGLLLTCQISEIYSCWSWLGQISKLTRFRPNENNGTGSNENCKIIDDLWKNASNFEIIFVLDLLGSVLKNNDWLNEKFKLEYGWNLNIFGLKMTVKSKLEKYFWKSSMREPFSSNSFYFIERRTHKITYSATKNYFLSAWRDLNLCGVSAKIFIHIPFWPG